MINFPKIRLLVFPLGALLAFGLVGCSQPNTAPTASEVTTFSGDRSKAPVADQQRIQQMQQQAQQGQKTRPQAQPGTTAR